MRYKTVGEIIEFARQLHDALSRRYGELEQITTSERASLILDYLNRHERQLADAMDQYGQEAANGILGTWLQHTPEFFPQQLADRVCDVNLSSVEEIVQAALEVDDYLVQLYRNMVDKAEVEGVREVFENLLVMEDVEKQRISRTACQLNDL